MCIRDRYNIITSSYQIPQSNLVNTVDLSRYYTFTTSSDANVASSSNIGYYTTSIIIPDEYLTYGETNNFLVYNDQFVKKQDFINQVSGFSFDAGVQDYEFTYETQNNMQPNSTPNAFDITPDERYYIYTFGNEDPDDYAWGQLLYKNDDGTYTDITENVQFYLGSGSISVNYISTNVKFLNSGSHFIMGSTSFGTYIFSGSGEGVNRIYTNVSSGMTYNPSNMGVYHICSYNDDEYVFCSPYSWNSNNFAMYHMDYTTNTFTKLNNPTTLPNSTIYDIDVKPNGSHFVMAQTNSPYLYIYSGSGEGVNRIYTKLNVPNTQPTETARAVKYTPDNLYMICKSQNSTVDKYLVSYYTPTNNIYYKLAAPNSIAANQTPNNLYNHSTIIGDGTKYISTGGSSPRYDAYVSTGNTTSRVYNLITTNFDGIIKPTNSFIYKNNKLYCIQGLPNSNTMAPSASTSITIYNVDNINSPVLLNSGSENMLQDMWNIEEYAMSPKSDYFVTLLKNNPHIQVLKNTDGNFTKLADPTTLPIAPLNRIRFIRDYTFVCTQGSYWYMYNINTGSDTYSATQGGGNLTSFDIQMGGFGMYKLSDNHFFVSSDGTPPMKLFKYHDDIPSMSVMPDPTGFIADRFENIVIGASSDVVVGNYVIQTSNISPYIKIQYFNTQSETFQSVDTSNITLSGNPALLPTTQYNNLDYLFIFNYGTNEMLYYSGSGINENKTFTQINNTGDFVIYQYNSGIFKINPSGEYFITQDNAGIYLNKIVSYNPLEINQLEYYIFSNRGFFNSSPSQNAMFYSDYLFGISTSRDYLLFKIQNDSLVLLDNYPIDSNENAHYFNRFSNNHIVPYYNWKNPRKVFKMYQAASITSNKTSFRLNPDIELEIDVTYPIGKLGGLSGINIANIKEYNGVPLATIEETE